MKFNELVVLYFERNNAYWTLWGFYITFVIGSLAGFVAVPDKSPYILAGILTIGFIAFAWVNLSALNEVLRTRNRIAAIISGFPAPHEGQSVITGVKELIYERPRVSLWIFHLCSDAMFIAGLWLVACEVKK